MISNSAINDLNNSLNTENISIPKHIDEKEIWLKGYRAAMQEMDDLKEAIKEILDNHKFRGEWDEKNLLK